MKRIIIVGAICAFNLANATSEHDNKVCFPEHISNFTLTGYSFNPDQPFDTNITLTDNDIKVTINESTCLNIKAGRKLSQIPVNWVKNDLESSAISWNMGNMNHLGVSVNQVPEKLNFAIKLNITFNNSVSCNNVILGQGSNSSGLNDWWIFYNNSLGNDSLTCSYAGNRMQLLFNFPSRFNDYTFDFATTAY